ncbi:hypothetical protein SISNIDRAFT_417077, partial [Sistotremastrum niveocremeum HHB9708]
LNMSRKLTVAGRRGADNQRFMMAAATENVPRLKQLISSALRIGSSVSAIVNKIQDTFQNLKSYSAKGYEDRDYDIAGLCYRLGGRNLLYAFNQEFSLPSLRTLRRSKIFTNLMPSTGKVLTSDISFNIQSTLLSKVPALRLDPSRPFRTGCSIFWDEVSIEERACYFPHSDSVGGLCREHSSNIPVRLTSYENAQSIATALEEKIVHYGREASVIAVGSFGKLIRGAFPLLVSPTCKQENPTSSGNLLQQVFEAWDQHAATQFGPIWSFASDGDAGRRQMIYNCFVKSDLQPSDPLFKYVSRLEGLNKQVGKNNITADIDWKHEIKRVARVLRTDDGIQIGNTVVNQSLIRSHLSRNPDLSFTQIDMLLRPEDSQDVPRAIEFIRAIASVLSLAQDDLNPSQLQELQAISVISETFGSFVDAYICPEWNLTQQITSLAKSAHLAFSLFRRHGINFLPHQLYGDLQTTIKNVIFCIAKQQDMDGSQPFHLFWTGDDRLELLFGILRMQGGHNPNFTFKQLVDRLGAAVDLDAIYTRNPELSSGHRRLKIKRTEHTDHLNPESWIGNVVADSMDLEFAWKSGRDEAVKILSSIGITEDYQNLFSSNSSLDMLRPAGDGKYPGVSVDLDRSVEPIEASQPEASTSGHNISQESYPPIDRPSGTEDNPTEEQPSIGQELHIPHNDGAFAITGNIDSSESSLPSNDIDVELEDLLPPPEELPAPSNISEKPSAWIEYQGRKITRPLYVDLLRPTSLERPMNVYCGCATTVPTLNPEISIMQE